MKKKIERPLLLPLVGAFRYGGPALTSLELVDYPETILPENALSSLTSLRSLTVRYRYIREGIECRLTSWLSPLHQLETLTIIGQSHVAFYHRSLFLLLIIYWDLILDHLLTLTINH